MRKSLQRETILRAVRSAPLHPGADWVYHQVRQEIPNISMGTVYRNLHQMSEAGLIRQLDIGTTSRLYDGNCSDHSHVRCFQCGCIADFNLVMDGVWRLPACARSAGMEITPSLAAKRNKLAAGLCLDPRRERETL